MFRYQKRGFAVYIAVCVLLGVARILAFDCRIIDENLLDTFFIIALTTSGLIFILWSTFKSKRILEKFNNCFVEEFIWFYDLEFNSSKNQKVRRISGVNLAAGLYAKGKFKEAKSILLEIGPVMARPSGINPYNLMYFNNLGVTCGAMGEIEATKECLDRIDEIVGDNKMRPKMQKRVEAIRRNLYVSILIVEKEYEAARRLLTEEGPVNSTMMAKVAHQASLAFCYANLGEPQKAKELYEFVVANGGDTCYAAKARERLKALAE